MSGILQEFPGTVTPEALLEQLAAEPGRLLLRSGGAIGAIAPAAARYSFVTARPMIRFASRGSRCEVICGDARQVTYGNPWALLEALLGRFELLDEADVPFPLGGCFGYWGYDLKSFVEPRLTRRARQDLDLPDCHLGFHPSLVAFDHALGKTWIVATGLQPDGARSESEARRQADFWREQMRVALGTGSRAGRSAGSSEVGSVSSTFTRAQYLAAVQRAQAYIRAGDIYQVNLAQRLTVPFTGRGWEFFRQLSEVSPAPYAAYLEAGDFQVASSSPELFLRFSGSQVQTRPIKGTRPRGPDPDSDARLSYELQTSAKEMAELVMITDLLRNDLGRVCEYGSVHVPELARLERYSQVQHLVATVEGRLRQDITHLAALRAAFPGGSITGAPKIRAMEIIDELEPVTRGPYTGCLGYLGFNRESQLSILIRAAICQPASLHFHVGAGIVADSDPAAEYAETMAKAGGFLAALQMCPREATTAAPRAPARSTSA